MNAHCQEKLNLLTDQPYALTHSTATLNSYTELVTRSHTLGSLLKKTMNIFRFISARKYTKKMGLNLDETFTNLEREAWRIILLTSQRHYPFKELDKYNMVMINGVKCKKITNEHLAILFLGTHNTLIVSGKDPISKLLLTKAHLRSMHSSLHSMHATASTALSKLMTGKFGVLLTYGEDIIQTRGCYPLCTPCQ